jgi:hypothetical protein
MRRKITEKQIRAAHPRDGGRLTSATHLIGRSLSESLGIFIEYYTDHLSKSAQAWRSKLYGKSRFRQFYERARHMMRNLCAIVWLFAVSLCGHAGERPSRIIDLSCWKLTVPYDTERRGNPDEIVQPELDTFQDADCFGVTKSNSEQDVTRNRTPRKATSRIHTAKWSSIDYR